MNDLMDKKEVSNPPKKSCYIAGPMSGVPQYNFPRFLAAGMILTQDGWDVKNPAINDLEEGFDPRTMDVPPPGLIEKARRWDIEKVLEVDAVFALHGWLCSKGAMAEVAIAQWRGIPVHQISVEMGEDGKVKFGRGPDAPSLQEMGMFVHQSNVAIS